MEKIKSNHRFIVSLVLPVFIAALYYLFRLNANNELIFEVVLLLGGMYLGVTLYVLDATELYKHYAKVGGMTTQPDDVIGTQQAHVQSEVGAVGSDSATDAGEPRLITRSVLFILSLVPLGIFLLTSTGSVLGVGLYIGLLASLSSELVSMYRSPHLIRDRFLYQLQRAPKASELMWFMIGVVGWTVFFSAIVVW